MSPKTIILFFILNVKKRHKTYVYVAFEFTDNNYSMLDILKNHYQNHFKKPIYINYEIPIFKPLMTSEIHFLYSHSGIFHYTL